MFFSFSAILALLIFFLFHRLKSILNLFLSRKKNSCERLKGELERMLSENRKIKQVSFKLQGIFDEVMALYDVTKEICKALETERVFLSFKEEIKKFIRIDDCRFLEADADLSAYKDYTALPLEINRVRVGVLLVNGIKEEEAERFHILAHQFILGMKRAFLYQKVQELAITDSLTQVSSRRYYLERFNEELERSKKFSLRFCCLMIDIDNFKNFNDCYGHLVGDAILREVSKRIKGNIRQIDLFGRYGGEEFAIILPETDKNHGRLVAERIRQLVEEGFIRVYDEDLKVTISIGISGFPGDGKKTETLIEKADAALYQAKHAGRNRVCSYAKV
ncbi:MAG: GGDEF domain-containing protein [Candidatus Omnitrophica bacterium]|nr:GGDEF domain-containing protein [Candidatus Omnitrophota bacterium]